MMKKIEIGVLSSSELREKYNKSYFLNEEMDELIIGIDSQTGSIIYDTYGLINDLITEYEDDGFANTFESWDELYDYCAQAVYAIFEGFENDVKNQAVPKLLDEGEYEI